VDLTGAVNISRTGTDSQLVLWYNQYHLPVPLENVEEGAYITVELNKVSRSQFLAKPVQEVAMRLILNAPICVTGYRGERSAAVYAQPVGAGEPEPPPVVFQRRGGQGGRRRGQSHQPRLVRAQGMSPVVPCSNWRSAVQRTQEFAACELGTRSLLWRLEPGDSAYLLRLLLTGPCYHSLCCFQIDKEALNTSVLTIPFLKHPFMRQPVAQTTTTADAHQGNMHSVAMVETTLYRRNGKESW
jgi:hypothetical protein